MGTMRFNWTTKLKLAEVCCFYAGVISTLPSPRPPPPLPPPTAFSWSAVLFWKLCESSSSLHHIFHLTLILQIITGISKKISRQEHLWLLSIKPNYAVMENPSVAIPEFGAAGQYCRSLLFDHVFCQWIHFSRKTSQQTYSKPVEASSSLRVRSLTT